MFVEMERIPSTARTTCGVHTSNILPEMAQTGAWSREFPTRAGGKRCMMAQTFSTQLRNTMYFNAHRQEPPKRFTPPNLTCLATRVNTWANTDKANELIQTDLFRPPHGHMRWLQYMVLKRKYRIVMWDLVTRDYSKRLNGPQVFAKVKKYARNGSIITFHDSLKSEKNMKYALPRSIEWLLEQGYEFKVFD